MRGTSERPEINIIKLTILQFTVLFRVKPCEERGWPKAEGRRSTEVPSCVYWNEVEIEQGGMSILKTRISKICYQIVAGCGQKIDISILPL